MKNRPAMLRLVLLGLLVLGQLGIGYAEKPDPEYLNRLEKASKTIGPLVETWRDCIRSETDRFALQSEPAETIVTAAFAACTEQEYAWRGAIIESGFGDGEETLAKAKEEARGPLILRILRTRAKPSP